ncbi:MAG: GNAT family N-acetyltransferase [Halothermotrichaceae bacterium]
MALAVKEQKYKIRKAYKKDAEAIYQLVKKAFVNYNKQGNTPVTDEKLADVYQDIIHNIVLVIENNNKIIGTLRLQFAEEKSCYLKRFSIDPDYQDQGLGTMLYLKSEQLAFAEGKEYIYLYSTVEKENLINFYNKLGFICLKTDCSNGYQRGLWIKKLDGVD